MDDMLVGVMVMGCGISMLWPLSYAVGTLQRIRGKVIYPLLRVKQGASSRSLVKKGGSPC